MLSDWLPRNVIADPELLGRAPDVLRRLIRFSHAERAVSAPLTDDTLAAVDAYEPDFRRAVASFARGHGSKPPLFTLIDGDHPPDVGAYARYGETMLGLLADAVGGEAALAQLDDTPLPDEPLDLTGVAQDVHGRVRAIAALTDRCCDELLDVECRTACRRLLADVAASDPRIFRRRLLPWPDRRRRSAARDDRARGRHRTRHAYRPRGRTAAAAP